MYIRCLWTSTSLKLTQSNLRCIELLGFVHNYVVEEAFVASFGMLASRLKG